MVKRADWIWVDGELVPWDSANIHVLSHGIHYGFGVFEGIRAYKQASGGVAVLALDQHMRRLIDSARLCTLDIPYSVDELNSATIELLQKNQFTEGCYIRPVAMTGPGEMGISAFSNRTIVAIAAWEWGAYLGQDGLENGIRCMISSYRRARSDAAFHKGKITGQYVTSILAKREAMKAGFDEAILLSDAGYACEGSGENLFVIDSGKIYTPGLGMPILSGITRQIVLTIAQDLGIEVVDGLLSRDQLYTADEIFLTGTAAEVTPVREIDHRPIGSGTRGEITTVIQRRYAEMTTGQYESLKHLLVPAL